MSNYCEYYGELIDSNNNKKIKKIKFNIIEYYSDSDTFLLENRSKFYTIKNNSNILKSEDKEWIIGSFYLDPNFSSPSKIFLVE